MTGKYKSKDYGEQLIQFYLINYPFLRPPDLKGNGCDDDIEKC